MSSMEHIGLVASVIMPLFNVPLIVQIIRRRSSADISMAWLWGVWICSLLMAFSGFTSKDFVWRCFTIVNLILFTGVVVAVCKYRK